MTLSCHACRSTPQTKIDEYTRISTPRAEVLFKKGYLTRKMQFIESVSAMPSALPKSSSSPSDSASGSVVSNEETASCYSIQSLSPANGSDTTSATYPNDIYDPDMSLYYSSGYYDNSGYFYVNRMYSDCLVHSHTLPHLPKTHNDPIEFILAQHSLITNFTQPMFTITTIRITVQRL